jgi:hypothetical protein
VGVLEHMLAKERSLLSELVIWSVNLKPAVKDRETLQARSMVSKAMGMT